MALVGRLIHFRKKGDFDEEFSNNNIPEPSVVFIQDSREINTHGTRYRMLKWSVLESQFVGSAKAVAGDACLYDKKANKIVICPQSIIDNQDIQRYIPIGIVVVPGNHNVYGNGKCGVMSIKAMDCSAPSSGSVLSQDMCAGNSVNSPATNYTSVVIKDNGILSAKGFGYLAKDGSYSYSSYLIPDPYNPDESRNPDYYNVTDVPLNGMSDFSGKQNTELMVGLRGEKDYSSWVPSPSTKTDWPAISCCNMFFTPGTNQGDWYLPAMGELGYLMSRWSNIIRTVSILNDLYGNVAAPIVTGDCYWSSTEYSAVNLRYVHTANGAGHSAKATAFYYARAFITV